MNLDKAIACFKALGLRPEISRFEHRLIIQKVVYLLQVKGIGIGFEYSLYVRGPYSPDLTKVCYQQQKRIERLETKAGLTANESAQVEELKGLFGLKPGLLEVAATYAFFAFQEKQDPITALKSVKKLKPFYSETQIAIGVSRAKEFLFQPTDKDVSELKKELSSWQEAALGSVGRG